MSRGERRRLEFKSTGSEEFLNAALRLVDEGAEKLILRPWNEAASRLARELLSRRAEIALYRFAGDADSGVGAPAANWSDIDAAILLEEGDQVLPGLLHDFLPERSIKVLAPVTDRHWSRQSLFLISIPKAGTHLLYSLASVMGYEPGIEFGDFSDPGRWYCLEYSNSHTSASDFFIDSVRRAPFGNRLHPFMSSPTMFIYRNPLDILVSEANYYQRDGKTAFAAYFSRLSFEERIEKLIDDRWLLGSIRDRVGQFIPWLEFPNVIPIAFEELIGPAGGGNRTEQVDLIWSLQLKLQVPGDPSHIADKVFDPDSPTFFQGQIGAFKSRMIPASMEKFSALSQDFMEELGYSLHDLPEMRPRRALEFRMRPLVLSPSTHDDTPIAVEYNYLSFNLVRYRRCIYAVPQRLGPSFDLSCLDPGRLKLLPHSRSRAELKQKLLLGSARRIGVEPCNVEYVYKRLTGRRLKPLAAVRYIRRLTLRLGRFARRVFQRSSAKKSTEGPR